MPYDSDTAIGGEQDRFPTTRRSHVARAMGGNPESRAWFEAILAVYWKPAYKHVRCKWGRSNEDAKDLVQGFFTTLLEGDVLSRFDPARGSFRNYLRTCIDHYVLKQREWEGRLKRGGDTVRMTLPWSDAEQELQIACGCL